MSAAKVSQTTELTAAVEGDLLAIVDISDTTHASSGTTKKITLGNLISSVNSIFDHGTLSGLSDDDHTQYMKLTGRSGGQVLIGGTGVGDDLTFQTTSNGSKGSYIFSELSTGLVKSVSGTLSAITSSADLATVIDDETGTGSLVFGTSPVLTTPQINDSASDHQYIFASADLVADRTVSLPLLTGNDTFVFQDFIQTLTNKTLTSPTINSATINTSTLVTPTVQNWNGWMTELAAPNTMTSLGNRSYTVVFNSVDYTDRLSEGMRMRLTRTTAAPSQATDLEAGSSQYYNKASPNKCTFTDDFVCSAWIKVESYAAGTIIARYNGTSGWAFELDSSGRLKLIGYNANAANFSQVLSFRSVPLGQWIHVAAQLDMSAFTATTTTSYIMIDGLDVPAIVSRGGTNPTALVQPAADLQVGAKNTAQFFDGKLAQVAYYTAKVTQATILASIDRTLTGSETSLGSAYSFSNSINDLNTTTPNNLTANNSAVATNADSPFAGGAIAGILEYGLIMAVSFSTNTTVTVQVPEGYAIPTTGGISAVAYSTHKAPFGFPQDRSKWKVWMKDRLQRTQATPSAGTWYNVGSASIATQWLQIPVGSWTAEYFAVPAAQDTSAATDSSIYTTLSTASNTQSDAGWTRYTSYRLASAAYTIQFPMYAVGSITVSSMTTYYLNTKTDEAGVDNIFNQNVNADLYIQVTPSAL